MKKWLLIYIGQEKCLTGQRGKNLTTEQKSYEFMLNSVRQDIERMNKRLKNYGVVSTSAWRHSHEFNGTCINAVAKLVNVLLDFYPLTRE